MPSSILIETVVDVQEFAALQNEWNDLLARSASSSITLTWEWMFTWWEVFGEGRQLAILLARAGERLVGIAPLQRRRVRELGLSFQRIEFLATGEDEADEICSDYLDFIIEPGCEIDVLGAFGRYLTDIAAVKWDEMILESILADSPALGAARQAFAHGEYRFSEQSRTPSVVIRLPDNWEKFLMALSKKMRFRVRRHRRLIAEKGPVSFQRVITAAELAEFFPRFIDLHQRWWLSRGKPGCFASPRFTVFHQQVSRRLCDCGLLDLYGLSVADQLVAARYCFHFKGRMFDYQTGVDPAFDPRIGVGVECTGYCLEDAIQRGFKEYDFGGGTQAYKLRWTDQLQNTVNVRIARCSWKESIYSTLVSARTALRTLKHRLRPATSATLIPAGTKEE